MRAVVGIIVLQHKNNTYIGSKMELLVTTSGGIDHGLVYPIAIVGVYFYYEEPQNRKSTHEDLYIRIVVAAYCKLYYNYDDVLRT